jgi:hypothetical protein
LYGTVEGIEFQQGLPDLDNLDPREKHFIILDDRIRLEPKKNPDYWFSKYNTVLLHYPVSIAAAAATATYIPVSSGGVYPSVNGGGGVYSRQWKIEVCPTVRSQHQTHDDSQARSDLMVLW